MFGKISYEGVVRKHNEDRILIISNKYYQLYAIFDGHGGSGCADYLVKQFRSILEDEWSSNLKQTLTNTCKRLDKEYEYDKSGSCVIAILIYMGLLYVCNLGDSRAIMSSNQGKLVYTLSRDHKVNDE